MADKDNSPKPHDPSEKLSSQEPADAAADETIHIDGLGQRETLAKSSDPENVSEVSDKDESSTLIPDMMETLDPDVNLTLIPDEKPAEQDPESNQEPQSNLDTTVVHGQNPGEVPGEASSETPGEGFGTTSDVDAANKTVSAGDLEGTVQYAAVDPTKSTVRFGQGAPGKPPSASKANVSVGRSYRGKPGEKTAPATPDDTTADLAEGQLGKEAAAHSVMSSVNIGDTINPRELSDKDAAFWGSLSAERDSKQDPSVLPPAIDRSLTESKLQIRGRHVVTPKSDPSEPSDYRLVRLLGTGGMGNVYVARQGSLDRLLAVKVIKPLSRKQKAKLREMGKLAAVEQERRQQFLSEAVVTGDLDHPNIVPIHDVAVTADNTLFYSMKRVVGTPWSKELHKNSLQENVEILLKAADAVGFAHTRGVVHRDIKPENIMLGDFGVVMVMDWGLALANKQFEKIDSIFPSTGLGGSPAFMAPEMAVGPIDKIGPQSDIYLLGATLFLIITGSPPHSAANVSQCLKAVASNKIREPAPEQQGELLDIAMKAMSTNPQDRYPDVKSFQHAIRQYQLHERSIELHRSAAEALQRGKDQQSYADFSQASFGFQEAIKAWDENATARTGLQQTKLAYAEAAYEKRDFELGLSLLDEDTQEHREVIQKLNDGLRQRDSRQKLIRGLQLAAAAMLATILIGGGIALYMIEEKRQAAVTAEKKANVALKAESVAKEDAIEAEKDAIKARNAESDAKVAAIQARDKEETERKKAEEQECVAYGARFDALVSAQKESDQRKLAEAATVLANAEKDRANAEKDRANTEKDRADAERDRAEYEEFVSKIRLAKASIEQQEFGEAIKILESLRQALDERGVDVGWEWHWLWSQANESQPPVRTPAAANQLSLAATGSHAIATLADGTLELVSLDSSAGVHSAGHRHIARPEGKDPFTAAAISPRDQTIATATFDGVDGEISIWDAQMESVLFTLSANSHAIGRINDLTYTPDGLLLSASADRTVRLWDPNKAADPHELAVCWHISPVLQVDVAAQGSSLLLATVVGDDVTGTVALWRLSETNDKWQAESSGNFLQHMSPVSSIALAPNGQWAASGDAAGNVLLWETKGIEKIEYARSIARSVAVLSGRGSDVPSIKAVNEPIVLIDTQSDEQLVSTTSVTKRPSIAHADAVRSLRFSGDGKTLLSGSDDNTLKLWDVEKGEWSKTLKGHGGWVTAAEFVRGSSDAIVSASKDKTVRRWAPRSYVGAMVVAAPIAGNGQNILQTKPHVAAVWSARFSPNGNRVVSASRDHTARILEIDPDTLAFRQVAVLKEDEPDVASIELSEGSPFVGMSLAIDRQHQRLYVGSADSVVRIWNLQSGTELGALRRTGLNAALAVSSPGRLLVTGSSSPHVDAILWRLHPDRLPEQLHLLEGHDQAITAFAISPDESMLFSGDRNGYGLLWNTETGRRLGESVEAARDFRINAAAFSPDGNELLIASDKQQLIRVDLRSRTTVSRMDHDGFVTRLSVSADGRYALTVSEQLSKTKLKTAATLWDLRSGQSENLVSLDSPIDKKARVLSAEFGDLEQQVVIGRSAADGAPAMLEVWQLGENLREAKKLQELQLPARLAAPGTAIPLSNKQLVTLNGEAAFKWDVDSRELVKSYRAHAAVTQASFSYDGEKEDSKYVVTSSRSIKIWNAETGVAVAKRDHPHQGPVRSVQFLPNQYEDGSSYLLATGGDDGIARTWRWQPGDPEPTMVQEYKSTVLPDKILSVCFSPQGNKLLAVGSEGFVRVWNLDNPDSPTVYDQESVGEMKCGAFSPDGSLIVVGSGDEVAWMWKVVDPGEPIPDATRFEGHAGSIDDVAFIQGETKEIRVLTASADKSARVWDPQLTRGGSRQGREIISLRGHTKGVTAIDAARDGRRVVTAGSDGTVILWPAEKTPPKLEAKPNLFEENLDQSPQ